MTGRCGWFCGLAAADYDGTVRVGSDLDADRSDEQSSEPTEAAETTTTRAASWEASISAAAGDQACRSVLTCRSGAVRRTRSKAVDRNFSVAFRRPASGGPNSGGPSGTFSSGHRERVHDA